MGVTCLHFCTSKAWGGLELYACTLMVELKNAGCTVLGVCAPNSKVDQFLTEHNIKTIHLPSQGVVSVSSIGTLKSVIKENNVDVLHVHFHKDIWNASFAVRSNSRKKLFLSIYMGVSSKNDILHRYIYKRVDAIFTSSLEMNYRLPELYPVPSSKIHFLPYGRYIDHYEHDEKKRTEIRAKYGIEPDEILVGTMVRIDPGKGAMDFARSFSYIDPKLRSKIKFLIVGEPTRKGRAKPNEPQFEEHCEAYRRELEAYVAAEGLSERILLSGFQNDLVGYLSAMDVFVFPSRDELYSLVVLDAMCMGLPVVAARAGGNLQQIEDGVNGLLYNVADSKDLAMKLMQYAQHPAVRKQHGKIARAFVEQRHSMTNTIQQLLQFYQSDRKTSL
jgi:glycosyltransferase involved in cell wall biosynthesis